MTEEDFRALLDVHVLGAFHCSKAVWPIMAEKQYGRIVMTTSASGLYGMLTLANYRTAKAAHEKMWSRYLEPQTAGASNSL